MPATRTSVNTHLRIGNSIEVEYNLYFRISGILKQYLKFRELSIMLSLLNVAKFEVIIFQVTDDKQSLDLLFNS